MEYFPQRKRNRLANYDYSAGGAYFITICTAGKENYFWTVGAALRRPPECLSKYGRIVEKELQKFEAIYGGIIQVDNYVIMPNHVHLLLSIHAEHVGGRRNAAPTVSSVINQFKGSISKAVGSSLWQKSFHDHIVRDESDFLRLWEYIDNNPSHWEDDCFYIDIQENQR